MKSLPYPQYRLKEIWKEGKALVWDEIQVVHKDYLKWLIENSILSELEALIGCGKYERNTDRKDYRTINFHLSLEQKSILEGGDY